MTHPSAAKVQHEMSPKNRQMAITKVYENSQIRLEERAEQCMEVINRKGSQSNNWQNFKINGLNMMIEDTLQILLEWQGGKYCQPVAQFKICFSKTRDYWCRAKAKPIGDKFMYPILHQLMLHILDLLDMNIAEQMLLFFGIFEEMICKKVKFNRTREMPLILDAIFLKPNRLKAFCQKMLQLFIASDQDWGKVRVTRSVRKGKNQVAESEYIRDKDRVKKLKTDLLKHVQAIVAKIEDCNNNLTSLDASFQKLIKWMKTGNDESGGSLVLSFIPNIQQIPTEEMKEDEFSPNTGNHTHFEFTSPPNTNFTFPPSIQHNANIPPPHYVPMTQPNFNEIPLSHYVPMRQNHVCGRHQAHIEHASLPQNVIHSSNTHIPPPVLHHHGNHRPTYRSFQSSNIHRIPRHQRIPSDIRRQRAEHHRNQLRQATFNMPDSQYIVSSSQPPQCNNQSTQPIVNTLPPLPPLPPVNNSQMYGQGQFNNSSNQNQVNQIQTNHSCHRQIAHNNVAPSSFSSSPCHQHQYSRGESMTVSGNHPMRYSSSVRVMSTASNPLQIFNNCADHEIMGVNSMQTGISGHDVIDNGNNANNLPPTLSSVQPPPQLQTMAVSVTTTEDTTNTPAIQEDADFFNDPDAEWHFPDLDDSDAPFSNPLLALSVFAVPLNDDDDFEDVITSLNPQ